VRFFSFVVFFYFSINYKIYSIKKIAIVFNQTCRVSSKPTNKQTMVNRCSNCREMGHNTRSCKRSSDEATAMRESFNEVSIRVVTFNAMKRREWLLSRVPVDVEMRVVDSRDHEGNVVFLASELSISRAHVMNIKSSKSIPKSLVKIQEILFDNSQDIPDGLYKDLMDALIIKD